MKTKSTLWRALSLAIFFTPAIAGAIQIKDKPQPRDCITHLTFDRTAIDFGHVDRMQASDRIARAADTISFCSKPHTGHSRQVTDARLYTVILFLDMDTDKTGRKAKHTDNDQQESLSPRS